MTFSHQILEVSHALIIEINSHLFFHLDIFKYVAIVMCNQFMKWW